MKIVEPSHFTDPDAAARKLVESSFPNFFLPKLRNLGGSIPSPPTITPATNGVDCLHIRTALQWGMPQLTRRLTTRDPFIREKFTRERRG
jgi:hypothetical protein